MQQFNLKLLLDFLQTKINALLAYDSITQEKLNQLAGKTVAVMLHNMNITIYIDFVENHFYLNTEKQYEPSLTLKGTPTAFLRLLRQSENYSVNQAVQVEGDLHLAQVLQASLRDLNIDWVEIIAPYTGDVVAGGLEQVGLGIKKWWQATRQTLWGKFRRVCSR